METEPDAQLLPGALIGRRARPETRGGMFVSGPIPESSCTGPEALAVRGKIEAAEREAQQGGNGLFSNAHLLHDWFYELATCASVVDVVADLIGPNVMIWKSQLWIKESGSGAYVGWHQGESSRPHCPPSRSSGAPTRLRFPLPLTAALPLVVCRCAILGLEPDRVCERMDRTDRCHP